MDDIRRVRLWMYDRLYDNRGGLKETFIMGVERFIDFACAQPNILRDGKIRCPCARCKSLRLLPPVDVKVHLYRKGFKERYWYWTEHGEVEPENFDPFEDAIDNVVEPNDNQEQHQSRFHEMVHDAFPTYEDRSGTADDTEDVPVEDARIFYEMLRSVNRPIYEGAWQSQLSMAARIMSVKSGYNIAHNGMDEIITMMRDSHLPDHADVLIPSDYASARRLVSKLGLESVKIHCCKNGCMLYYKEDVDLLNCKFCNMPRYIEKRSHAGSSRQIPSKYMFYLPIIPRLQRLFASQNTAPHMRWHAENKRSDGLMCHPSDGAAWKYFDSVYPDFAQDSRNVRLGLCADGFNPFNHSGANYSSWPVILTPYNLSPSMCMTAPYMFLTCIIPGPHNPKSKIDVYLQPLIDDLLRLWHVGVQTYDVSTRRNFNLRACLMWTINDFPAYGMLSGWQTAGRLACPYCMEKTKTFTLPHGRKQSWFDCHRQFLPASHAYRKARHKFKVNKLEKDSPPRRLSGQQILDFINDFPKVVDNPGLKIPGYGISHNWTKRSIFWNLPYWKDNLVRHNLDVMHIEKIFFDNLCNTIMDVKGKTKDNENARRDLETFCRRPELHLADSGDGTTFYKPKAIFTLTKDQRRLICEWVKNLRFPDGYASNLSRCVDTVEGKFHGLKSHDCHVMMQCLLPVMFRSLPKNVWEAVSDISTFFKDLCSTTLQWQDIHTLEQNIAGILCRLEMIFPPAFFDVMEHLPVHLPYEAWAGGPVQYRWMYPFERYIYNLYI